MFFKMFNTYNREKKRWPEFSKIHISETKVHLQKSQDPCLMDFDKLSFYHGPIAIRISWLRPSPSRSSFKMWESKIIILKNMQIKFSYCFLRFF